MNLIHYFDAVDFSGFAQEVSHGWKYSLGAAIEKQTLKFHEGNSKNIEMAIVGVPFTTQENECILNDAPNLIRKELYGLAGVGKLNIIDFGNLKPASSQKGNYLALRDVVDYLNELGVVTLIIGGSQDFSYGVCQAFRNNDYFSFCTLDAFLDVKKGVEPFGPSNYLSRIFRNQAQIFQFAVIGYQSHYVANEYFTKTKGIGAHIRLGSLREDLGVAEPVFRNSDFLSVDMGALKHSEAPGVYKLPNGLHSDEVCQLARYAGLSCRMNTFGVFNINENIDNAGITIALSAQVLWYFIQGFLKRSRIKPGEGDGFVVNKVEIAELDSPLVFYRNCETKQWWIELKPANRTMYVACSEKDYHEACNNEIPDIWLKYIQKTDLLLK